MKINDIFNEENKDKQYKFLNHDDKHIYTLKLYSFGKFHLVNEENKTIDQVNHLQDILKSEFIEVKNC